MLKLKLLFLTAMLYSSVFSYEILTKNNVAENTTDIKKASSTNKAAYILDEYSNVPLLAKYDNSIPSEIKIVEKFPQGKPELLDYIFIRTLKANVRAKPTINSEVIEEFDFNKKVRIYSKVLDTGNIWYEVRTSQGERGYISAQLVAFRTFRFNEALTKVQEVENFINTSRQQESALAVVNSYVPNPNNENMNRKKDKYGTSADQNTVGYNDKGEEIYIPDRSIMTVLSKDENSARVRVESIPEILTIDTKNLSLQSKLENQPVDKAIVVDTKNQNMMMFEKIDGEWSIISYVKSKTGMESQLGFETPKGSFLAAVSKFEMLYNNEISEKLGYAKYATRFSGGGYLHGTPVNYEELINKEYFINQKEATLGTLSGTRKCIRTSEDHARFVFEWVTNGNYNSNVNDQYLKDNILFVVL